MIKPYFFNISKVIIDQILSAKFSIKIAVAWFTNDKIFEALLNKCKEKSISVELVIILDSINIRTLGLDFNLLIQNGGNLYFGKSNALMHHKFCIIDDKILINGSYNWTYWAESRNKENVIIFDNQQNLIKSFNQEFQNLISHNRKIENISTSIINLAKQQNMLLNSAEVKLNEYVSSAEYYQNHGNNEKASNIFEELFQIDSRKANSILQQNLLSGNSDYKSIYNNVCSKTYNDAHNNDTYESLCDRINSNIKKGNYLLAIKIANSCSKLYPNKFSVHVYCGDAKKMINDLEGARKEYMKALSIKFIENSNILYYGQNYIYTFFPFADVYLKLGDMNSVISTLRQAALTYRKLKNEQGVLKAEQYLQKISNNEKISRIV